MNCVSVNLFNNHPFSCGSKEIHAYSYFTFIGNVVAQLV
jgi:hypothetical protein